MNRLRKKTIYKRILIPLLMVALIQFALYTISFSMGGIFSSIRENYAQMFGDRTANRQLYVQNEMVSRWSNVEDYSKSVSLEIDELLNEKNLSASDILTDVSLNDDIISHCSNDILSLLRRNGTTGAFIILNGDAIKGESQTYASMYVRDMDPSNNSDKYADVLLERGLPTLSRTLGLSLDSFWQPSFTFDEGLSSDFYFNPLNAVSEYPGGKIQDYGYWSPSFRLASGVEIVTYTVPIILSDGTACGVLGVEIASDYLARQLRYDELSDGKRGAYFIGVTTDNGSTYRRVCTAGPAYMLHFGEAQTLNVLNTEENRLVEIESVNKSYGKVLGSIQPFSLYNTNTPFENEKWVLIGLSTEDDMFEFYHRIINLFIFISSAILLIAILIAFAVSHDITLPIRQLLTDLVNSDPNRKITLRRLNLAEIDDLSGSIESLSTAVSESASRISKIIQITGLPIGIFEYSEVTGLVFCSKSFLSILGSEDCPSEGKYLSMEEFRSNMFRLSGDAYNTEDKICTIKFDGKDRHIQLKYVPDKKKIIGAIIDITRDVEEKKKIEYERDYDALTSLYNRRAFETRASKMFEKGSELLKTAAVIMVDLDNLKYLNDTYGHDYGDRYIQVFAQCLSEFNHYNALVARRSGDEFYILLYGYDSKDEVQSIYSAVWRKIERAVLKIDDQTNYKVRASGGIAWYPQDSTDFNDLVRYADFAMYTIKHTVKGALQEFSRETYTSDSILLSGQEALNHLIEERMVRYALQPIVSAISGDIYGYEMLMRPQIKELHTPTEVLRLARAQSKMYQIERLTWFEALSSFDEMCKQGKINSHERVFINSLAGQVMTEQDIKLIERKYPALLSRIVLEFTENEQDKATYNDIKMQYVKKWGAMLAIDDYGTGYNSETILIKLSPDLVKLDISFVRNIDVNVDRRALVANLLSYAKERNIAVLAEGVETKEEMETLINMGVEFLQGYYVGKPSFDVVPISNDVKTEIIMAKGIRRKN